jgi:hypothetical protein
MNFHLVRPLLGIWFVLSLEPAHLDQESTNNLVQNVTRYVIPEVCGNITYSIVSGKRDTFIDVSSICTTRVTSVTVIPQP